MFDNLFDLKIYKTNTKELIEIKTLNELENNNLNAVLLPIIDYKNKNYIIGDLFINKKTKEFLIFSFYTYNQSINRLGFFSFKNYKTFELFNNYKIEFATCSGFSNNGFHFLTLNEVIDLNSFEKIGNIFTSNKDDIFNIFYLLYLTEDKLILNKFEKIMEKINDFSILITNTESMSIYNSIQDKKIKKEIIIKNDLNFYPRILVKDSTGININGFNLQILSLKNEFINLNKSYILYFDKNEFKTFVLSLNDNKLEHLYKNKDKYEKLYPYTFDVKHFNKYKSILLYFISYYENK